jgi:hypothetical protein
MGEHVGPETFRVRDLTVQRTAGTFAAFVRIVGELIAPLRVFFERTNHDYRKFNYLGEWHSHHSFALSPSRTDHATMHEMVMDPQVGANFAVLLLVKLFNGNQLEGSITVYQPNQSPTGGVLVPE